MYPNPRIVSILLPVFPNFLLKFKICTSIARSDTLNPSSVEIETPSVEDNDSEMGIYNKIEKLNMDLDELANDLTVDELMDNSNDDIVNEITMPEVSSEEVSKDLDSNEIKRRNEKLKKQRETKIRFSTLVKEETRTQLSIS